MAHQSPIRNDLLSGSPGIPDKLYFRIGEVARLCEVPTYVLRFWESEFPQLKPNKGGTGQRLFRRRDVEMALRIKCLLYDEGYTIPGARQLLRGEHRHVEPQLPLAAADPVEASAGQMALLRQELREVLAMLSRPASASTSVTASGSARRHRPPNAVERRTENLFDFARPHDEKDKG